MPDDTPPSTQSEPKMEPDASVYLISVSARIPEFWADQPGLWFVQFEAAVNPQNASDSAKFQLLITKLGKQVIQQVADLISNPPLEGKYKAVKDRLMDVYAESESKRIQKLISDMQLGDQKPSQLLRQMQNLAGNNVTQDTLLVLWQNHLPLPVRTVLAATALSNSDKLAEVADKVAEMANVGDVAAVTQQQPTDLAAAVQKLSIEVAELRKGRDFSRRNRNQRSRSRSRSHAGARGSSQQKKTRLCYYHHRFGTDARKCREPCAWKKQDNKQEN